MKANELIIKVEKEDILSSIIKSNLSKRFYRFLKSSKAKVFLDGIEESLWYKKVNVGMKITIVYQTLSKEISWPKSNQPPKIVYENDHYLVVDKPANLLTIPTQANPNSLYQQLVYYLGEQEIHILNRLDKETSGLIVVAKDRYAASLLEPVHQHIKRKYLCLVEGRVQENGTIINLISKSENSNRRFVSDTGKIAISHYKVIVENDENSLLEFELETGRTHQIRVHTSHMGHPIVGDNMYGKKDGNQLCLLSYFVEFFDPFLKDIIQCDISQEECKKRLMNIY